MIKIEAGKYYRTRDGRKVGPIFYSPKDRHIDFPWADPTDAAWRYDGMYSLFGITNDKDLVEEWVEGTDMTQEPKTWGQMSPEEKGALLLAHHEGKTIEVFVEDHDWSGWVGRSPPVWAEGKAYRIRPEPVRKTVTLYGYLSSRDGYSNFGDYSKPCNTDTHRIIFDTLDGEPVLYSIKMEKL